MTYSTRDPANFGFKKPVIEDGFLLSKGKGVVSDRHLLVEYQPTNLKCGWCGGHLWQNRDSRQKLRHLDQDSWERHVTLKAILEGAKP